jgi:hypothetical protein
MLDHQKADIGYSNIRQFLMRKVKRGTIKLGGTRLYVGSLRLDVENVSQNQKFPKGNALFN